MKSRKTMGMEAARVTTEGVGKVAPIDRHTGDMQIYRKLPDKPQLGRNCLGRTDEAPVVAAYILSLPVRRLFSPTAYRALLPHILYRLSPRFFPVRCTSFFAPEPCLPLLLGISYNARAMRAGEKNRKRYCCEKPLGASDGCPGGFYI